MLTKLTIRNFKRFHEAEIELGGIVVFVGPNNSGKTTALQALALWNLGLRRWEEKYSERPSTKTVTLNRLDLVSLPVPVADLLWKNSKTHAKKRRKVPIEIIVEGIDNDTPWSAGLEFTYLNEESVQVRPVQLRPTPALDKGLTSPSTIPEQAQRVNLAYLPPMSGLAANETRLQSGAIDVRIGEGRTAEVLRNVCAQLFEQSVQEWGVVRANVKRQFGVMLENPVHIPQRGEIAMSYTDAEGYKLDLSCAGRGLQQTLLLLAYMHTNPGSVLLLDEPDAHLEMLRQRELYQLLTEMAREQNSQIIAASHSEIILNEAADRDIVVAFVGKPHRIDDRGAQVVKSLKTIGFDQYYQAERVGWVLYLEGSTDLAILRAFAKTLQHPAAEKLERPFVDYVGNQASRARDHFFGLREAKPDLSGIVILDRDDRDRSSGSANGFLLLRWRRREIENYLCQPAVLQAYAERSAAESTAGPLFSRPEAMRRREAMDHAIKSLLPPIALENSADRYWSETKISDEFLDRIFDMYFKRLGLPNLMRKTDYHELASLVPRELLDPEITEKLDAIVDAARAARPVIDPEQDAD